MTSGHQYRDDDLLETQVSSEQIYQGGILAYYKDTISLPDGSLHPRETITHPGGVVIMPVLPNGKLILLRQFRYALRHVLHEFPAGKLDNGEDPLTCAKRELEEETGYAAEHWEELTYIYTSPGFCNEKLYLFKASGLTPVENPRREEGELLQLMEVTVDELEQMIQEKTLVDAKTMCALRFL